MSSGDKAHQIWLPWHYKKEGGSISRMPVRERVASSREKEEKEMAPSLIGSWPPPLPSQMELFSFSVTAAAKWKCNRVEAAHHSSGCVKCWDVSEGVEWNKVRKSTALSSTLLVWRLLEVCQNFCDGHMKGKFSINGRSPFRNKRGRRGVWNSIKRIKVRAGSVSRCRTISDGSFDTRAYPSAEDAPTAQREFHVFVGCLRSVIRRYNIPAVGRHLHRPVEFNQEKSAPPPKKKKKKNIWRCVFDRRLRSAGWKGIARVKMGRQQQSQCQILMRVVVVWSQRRRVISSLIRCRLNQSSTYAITHQRERERQQTSRPLHHETCRLPSLGPIHPIRPRPASSSTRAV